MQFSSPAFDDGGMLPERVTCDGAGVSPELRWTDIPEETMELALLCEDPDAPRGTFVHWIVWAMDPRTSGTPEGGPVDGIEGLNDYGKVGWGPPCPPKGDRAHRYVFTLYALRARLALLPGATAETLRAATRDKVIALRTLTGRYERRQ